MDLKWKLVGESRLQIRLRFFLHAGETNNTSEVLSQEVISPAVSVQTTTNFTFLQLELIFIRGDDRRLVIF